MKTPQVPALEGMTPLGLPAAKTEPICHCYARQLNEEQRFSLRYGAHEARCPIYRESGDPVDRQQDLDDRNYWTGYLSSPSVRGRWELRSK